MTTIYLAEVTVYDPALPGERVLRYATGTGYNHPSAPSFYDPRIQQPMNARRDLFSEGRTGGRSQVGFGELVLVNVDGALDPLIDYGFDGRQLKILIGDHRDAYGAFATLLLGTMEQPEFELDALRIRMRDRQAELDVPIQATKYAGTNALPNGIEGTEDDIKGLPKPLAFGMPENVTPPMVNTDKLIFQVNDGPIADVPATYDQGIALGRGADYASQADMETNAPAGNQYRVWPGGGFGRLGSTPAGQITCDVTQGAAAADRTAAQILKAIATRTGGIAAGDVVAGDVTALDADSSAVLGLWVGDEAKRPEVMDLVAESVGAWWGFDRDGALRMRRFEAPAGAPAITFRRFTRATAATAGDADIISLARIPSNDFGAGVPAWHVDLDYRRNWTVQASGLAGGVTPARREFLKTAWRTIPSEDATVKTKHKLASELRFQSLIVDPAAAQAEADRRRDLFKLRRDRYKLTAKLSPANAALLDLGVTVKVQIARFGLDAGKLFLVTGIEYDAAASIVDLDIWG